MVGEQKSGSSKRNNHSDGAYSSEYVAPRQVEWLKVTSGIMVIIDQFMLANAQFLSLLRKDFLTEDEQEEELAKSVHTYGGAILRLSPGRWAVFRDPLETLILLAPVEEGNEPSLWEEVIDREALLTLRANSEAINRVFVDTRCMVFLDAELLQDTGLIDKFCELRHSGNDKAARDLLREHGAAVRYGFNRAGDELGVFKLPQIHGIALWPDVVDILPREGQRESENTR